MSLTVIILLTLPLLSRTMLSSCPDIPKRESSLNGPVTKKDEILYLAGRKPYVAPPSSVSIARNNHLSASISNSSLVSVGISDGVEFPGGINVADTMDKIFTGSSISLAMSDDSASIQSSDVVGAVTPEAVRRSLHVRHPPAPGLSQNSLQHGHAPRPESPSPPR